jgi:class 3 adenylate cyclase
MDAVRYVRSDGHHLAYRVVDSAEPRDVVLFTPGGTVPMDFLARDRIGARLVDGLAAMGRLVLFDRRGIGLSDPITDWSRPLVEQWAEDLALVIAGVCTNKPVVVSLGDYWGPARLFAGRHREKLAALVLYEPTGPIGGVDLSASVAEASGREGDWMARVCPSRANDRTFREWFDEAGRSGASPGVANRIYERPPDATVRQLHAAHEQIAVPTLVLRRPQNLVATRPAIDPVAAEIPHGRQIDLPGTDYHWLGEDIDSVLAEVSRFIVGEALLPAPRRELCAVLFTDLVGSTEHATTVGDLRWTTTLDRLDAATSRQVARHGGAVIKTTGDGVLATFPSADRALRAADAIRADLALEGLGVRMGVHVGDIERRSNDVAGIGVHIAARIMAHAGPDETLVSASVPIAAAGTEHRFQLVGDRVLKGVAGTWPLYRTSTSGGGTTQRGET